MMKCDGYGIKVHMKKLTYLWMVLAVLWTTACTSSEKNAESTDKVQMNSETVTSEAGETYTFVDDLGREVTVNQPKRVAALLGSYADMWVLAGGTVYASADDAWEDFSLDMPEDAVNLGKTKEISLEKLFESKPDFILASTNTRIHMEWKDTLEASGIPTAYFDVADFEDYLRVLKICTDITGRSDLYEHNGLAVQAQIKEVLERSEARLEAYGAEKILIVRVSAGMVRAKNSQDNVLGEMLHSLGCINIADSDTTLLENLSAEHILSENPDLIFILEIGDSKEAAANFERFVQENPMWEELTAVKEQRVYAMDKTLYNLKPNDRWGEAYEKLENILESEKE